MITLLLSGLTAGIPATPPPPSGTPIPASYFAVTDRSVQGYWPPVDTNGQRLPAKVDRMWDTGTTWADLEPASGSFTWSNLDKRMATAQANGMDVEITFGTTPGWAGSCGTCGPSDVNSDGSGTDAAWQGFITAVATRYTGKIKYYEVWNEFNASNYWTGTNAQMGRLAEDMFKIVHSIDPAALVSTPSMAGGTGEGPRFTAYFSTTINDGTGSHPSDWCDAIAFHGRNGSNNATPETIVTTVLPVLLPVFQQFAPGKPIFMTEGGWRPGEVTDPDAQTAYVARYYLVQAGIVDKVYWYGWDNGNCWGTLVETSKGSSCFTPAPPAGPTAAATAYTQVASWLAGSVLASPCAEVNSIWTCNLTESNGKKAMVIWNPAGNSTYNPDPSFTQFRDLLGATTQISGGSVTIGTKPILLEGIGGVSKPPAAPLNLKEVIQ